MSDDVAGEKCINFVLFFNLLKGTKVTLKFMRYLTCMCERVDEGNDMIRRNGYHMSLRFIHSSSCRSLCVNYNNLSSGLRIEINSHGKSQFFIFMSSIRNICSMWKSSSIFCALNHKMSKIHCVDTVLKELYDSISIPVIFLNYSNSTNAPDLNI